MLYKGISHFDLELRRPINGSVPKRVYNEVRLLQQSWALSC